MSRTTVLILAVVSAIFLFFALIMVVSSAREKARAAGPSTPPSRRPGPTDEALEGPLLEKYQVAGVALTVFLAVLLPFLYLREPARQKAAASKELTESVRLGQATFEEFCARCHGDQAQGGNIVVDTAKVITGPPRGTNTTGQELQGPHCVGGGGA